MVGVITLSIVLIFLVHQVYEYLKKSFSKPLERNIVNETKSHYEQIYNTLATSRQMPAVQQMSIPIQMTNQMSMPNQASMPTEIYAQPPQQQETMADELMNFMSDLENSDNSGVVAPQLDVVEDDIQPYEQELDGISTF
jgi:hypothetical protein